MKRIFVTSLLALIPLAGFAYIPPSGFIVKNIAAKRAIIKSGVRIKAEVSSLIPGKADIKFRVVLAYDPAARILRAWAVDSADRKLYQLERKAADFTLADSLAFESRSAELERALKASGVPIKTEEELLALPDEAQRLAAETLSLKRIRNIPCWVIGKEATGHSALWIEKDSFNPLKFVFSRAADPSLAELQFDSYRFQHGFGFPSTTTVIDRSALAIFREDLRDLYTGPITADFKGTIKTGFTEDGASAPDSMKELLEQYFKYLR